MLHDVTHPSLNPLKHHDYSCTALIKLCKTCWLWFQAETDAVICALCDIMWTEPNMTQMLEAGEDIKYGSRSETLPVDYVRFHNEDVLRRQIAINNVYQPIFPPPCVSSRNVP